MNTQANIHYDDGVWCVAVFVDGEHDCNEILTATTELAAIEEVTQQFDIQRDRIKVIPWA